jgi:hypothetical protein
VFPGASDRFFEPEISAATIVPASNRAVRPIRRGKTGEIRAIIMSGSSSKETSCGASYKAVAAFVKAARQKLNVMTSLNRG